MSRFSLLVSLVLALSSVCVGVSGTTPIGLYVKDVPILADNDGNFNVAGGGWFANTALLTGGSYEPVDIKVDFDTSFSAFPYYQRMVQLAGGTKTWTNGLQMRVGGVSCNSLQYNVPTGQTDYFGAIIPRMQTGVKTLNASFIVCLPLAWTTAQSAAMAVRLHTALGSHLTGLELGNEPDGAGMTYANYLAAYSAHRNAILASVPTMKFQALASAWDAWPEHFTVAGGDIAHYDQSMLSVSMHNYYSTAQVSSFMRYIWPTGFINEAKVAHSYGARWSYGETNINVYMQQYAATIYVLDNICSAASSHADAMSWTGAYTGYSPLIYCGSTICANGHYYAMWAYASLMGEGGYMHILKAASTSEYVPGVRIYQASNGERTTGLVVLNKQNVSASVDFSTAGLSSSTVPQLCSGCAYIKLLAPPVSSSIPAHEAYLISATTGITWGGQTLSNVDGSVKGTEQRIPFTSWDQAIVLQPYTIAVVFFTK